MPFYIRGKERGFLDHLLKNNLNPIKIFVRLNNDGLPLHEQIMISLEPVFVISTSP